MKRICAWCKESMGEIAPEQPGITHGICEECKKKILAEAGGQDPTFSDGDSRISIPPLPAPRPLSDEKCPYCGTRHVYGDCQYIEVEKRR